MEDRKTPETTVINLVRLTDAPVPNHNITHSAGPLRRQQRNRQNYEALKPPQGFLLRGKTPCRSSLRRVFAVRRYIPDSVKPSHTKDDWTTKAINMKYPKAMSCASETSLRSRYNVK